MNLIYPSFLLLLTLFSPVFTLSNPNNNDSINLLSFKSTLLNPSILQNWLINNNPCEFTGISCSNNNNNKNSRVTSVNLSFLPLSTNFTSVTTYLFSLDFITSITLSNTNISGPITSFTCSRSLLQVDISNNFITDSFSNLNYLKSCSSLENLNVSFNRLDSKNIRGNDHFFGQKLKTFDASGNLLSGEEILPLILLNNCDNLEFLSLKGNKLLGSFDLGKCGNLVHFDISFNNFTTKLSIFGKSCNKLDYIDISSNKFYGDNIGDVLMGCDNLSFLNVSNNVFDGEFPLIPSKKMEYIYLGGNKFTGVIPEIFAINSCLNVKMFDVSFNHFVGVIPSSFGLCESMEVFDVSNNNFSGVLPIEMFTRMSSLRKLNLGFNKFEGGVPSSISTIGELEVLDLSSNNISGKIPSGFCEGSGLKELYLQNNMLIGEIPPSLGNCSKLISLDLSFNYLRGSIPYSLGQLPNLKDLIMWSNKLEGEIPFEVMYNKALENLILDNNQLSGGIPSGLRNCTNLNWISLSSNRLSGIIPSWIGSLDSLAILKLSNNSFYGAIPPELGECKSLLWLDLNSNMLNGSIPSALADQSGSIVVGLVFGKKFVYLRNAGGKECHGTGNLLEFSGIRADALGRLSTVNCEFQQIYKGITQPTFKNNGSMIFLDLSYNNLEGGIPKEIGKMTYLSILNLGHNNFSGEIPEEMEGLRNMGVLDLSYNSLSGMIPPALASLTFLSEIDLSNNKLEGLIPASSQLDTFPATRFANNSGLCGIPLPPCGKSSREDSSHHQKHGRRASLAGSIAMGLLFALFCIFGAIIVGIEVKKRRNKKDGLEDLYVDGNSNSYSCSNANTAWKYTSKHEALSISLSTFDKPLKKLTFADLLEATNGFHDDSMIGKGGFGDVYKARLKDGKLVAIKKLIHVGQGDREFMAEMETIGTIKHRNLVPLLGYCKVGDERLLVYEYMKYGSLEDVLHNRKKTGIKLNWSERRKIAMGAARGLAYLHHNCKPHIIHRDMKSSNVLLDENLEARVSDFGMARLMSAMDTHLSVSTLAGTPGYVPPEYYQSFRCSKKGDVYSYGVVLLELLTGRQPTDSVDFGDNNIVGWVKMHAKLKISDVFDPELIKEDPNIVIELLEHLKVAVACVDDRPFKRPTIIDVMAMFKEIQAGSGLDSGSIITSDDGNFGTMDVLAEVPEGNLK